MADQLAGNVLELEPERREYIGSSELAGIFGLSVYDTPGSIWSRKTGRTLDNGESTPDQLRGIHLEPVVREKVLPEKERVQDVKDDPHFYMHPEAPVGCHPDGSIIVAPHEDEAVLEIKCPNKEAFKRYREDGLPSTNVVQLLTTIALTRRRRGYFAVHAADSWETLLFDLELDQRNRETIERLLGQAKDWWVRYVVGDEPPPEFFVDDTPELPQLRGELLHRDDDLWVELMDEYGVYRQAKQTLERTWKGSDEEMGLKDRIVAAMEDEQKIQGGGWRMQRIQVERLNFSKKNVEKLGPLDPEKVAFHLEGELDEARIREVIAGSRLAIDDSRLYSVSRYESLRGDEVDDPMSGI